MPLFPTVPLDGQIVYVNGVNYFWSSNRQTWKRVLANALSATTSITSGGTSGNAFVGNLQAFANVIVADGVSSTFPLVSNISNQAQLVVHVDGIYQIPGVNFTANGNVLIFDSAPTANSEIVVQNAIFAGSGGTTSSGVATVTVSSSAPASPSDGALWLDNDNGKLAVYLGGGWIEVSSGAVNYTASAFVSNGDIATSANINAANVIASTAVYAAQYFYTNGAPFVGGSTVVSGGSANISVYNNNSLVASNIAGISISGVDANASVISNGIVQVKIGEQGTIASNSAAVSVGTTVTQLDSFPIGTYRTAKYIISVTGASSYQATEALIVHDDINSYLTTYAIIYTGANALMSFSSNIVSNNVVLWGTGTISGNAVRLQKTYVRT